ncbi:hypothetical protein AK830_g10351 [Neonectria ditissima]|uniref:Zn(2)-C6 fungal-type domain-containing protein n=1 Tax=Neonectria ditissima TaxID=78410 RepID=A0A0P7B6Q1_9HYPO|nr:hypothetical protein AK830_g10351 [Neonectria ditissima]
MEELSNSEPAVDSTGAAEAPAKRARVSIACMRCKTRKNRCDGGKPKCANCIANDAECIYSAVRKMRGQGKSKKQAANSGGPSLQVRGPAGSASLELSILHHDSSPAQTRTSVDRSLMQENIKNGSAVFPEFLLPNVYGKNLTELRTSIGGEGFGDKITPLLPLAVSRRLIQNSFTDVMAEHQLLDLRSFVALLNAQYAVSSVDPGGNPARWALVNAVIALALRVKTAPGSEAELSDIPRAYYRNATTVIPDLILHDSSLLSIQALLAMAMFAQGTSDTQAFVTLSTNASRQLELLSLRRLLEGGGIDEEEEERQKQVSRVAHVLEKTAIEEYSTRSILRSN